MEPNKSHITDEQIAKVSEAVVAFIERASKETASSEELALLPRMVSEFTNLWLGEVTRV